jgi:hypothetical protein
MTIPRIITLYAHTSSGSIRAARFRWEPSRGVSLEILHPEWGELAKEHYERGVPLNRERRNVTKLEGETFMQALLEIKNMSYYRYADESPKEDCS